MESVNILVRINGGHDNFGVDVCRKRLLNKDTVNVFSSVQYADDFLKLRLGGLLRQPYVFRLEARPFAGPLFAAHIGETRRIIPHKDGGKAGGCAGDGGRLCNLFTKGF